MNDISLVAIEPSQSDSHIAEMMVGLDKFCKEKQRGFVLTISGFDNDPRELYEIPEAVNTLIRLQNLGFFSLLEVSTTLDIPTNPFRGLSEWVGFGAFEGWLIATGKYQAKKAKSVELSFPSSVVEEFTSWLLNVSNPRCTDTVAKMSRGETQELHGFVMDEKGCAPTTVSRELDKGKVPTGSQRIDPLFPLNRVKDFFNGTS